MIKIGITGGYATGKTAVAEMFKKNGVKVIYADRIAHKIIKSYTPVWRKIVNFFGRDILKINNEINRQKLAGIVFKDKERLKRLNRFVHPFVKKEIKRIIKDRELKRKTKMLAADVPLLFEAGLKNWFDKIIVVSCNKDVQYKRSKMRDRIPRKEILMRINSQWPLSKKIKMADFIIDNNGSKAETKRQVKEICGMLKRR